MKVTENKSTTEPNIFRELFESFLPRVTIAREGRFRTAALLVPGLLAVWFGERDSRNPLKNLLARLRRPLLGFGLLEAYGYREPQRLPVGNAPDYVYSPADGRIITLQKVDSEPIFLGVPAYRLEIATNWLHVPVQRTPLPGQVKYILDNPKLPAKLGLQTELGLRFLLSYRPDHQSFFRLPGPLSSPRLVFFRIQAGQNLPVSQEIAVRGFGNPLLTTLFLPADGIDILCRVGQHVQAGMTVIGRISPP